MNLRFQTLVLRFIALWIKEKFGIKRGTQSQDAIGLLADVEGEIKSAPRP